MNTKIKLLYVLLILLSWNLVQGKLDLLSCELGKEQLTQVGCSLDIFISILSDEVISIDSSSSISPLSISIQERYGPYIAKLFAVRGSYSFGPKNLSVNAKYANGTLVEVLLGKEYDCLPLTAPSLSYYATPLFPTQKNWLFFYLLNIQRSLQLSVVWISPGYSSLIYQNPYYLSSFSLLIFASPNVSNSSSAQFNLMIGNYQIGPTMSIPITFSNYGELVSSSYSGVDGFYNPKRPFLYILAGLESLDPRNLWYQVSDVDVFRDYLKGSPMASSSFLISVPYLTQTSTLVRLSVYNGETPANIMNITGNNVPLNPVVELVLTQFINSQIDCKFIRVLFDLAYDRQDISLTGVYYRDKGNANIPFPFGIVKGTFKEPKYDISFSMSPYYSNANLFISVNEIFQPVNVVSSLSDIVPPIIHNLTLTHVSGPNYLLKATITDDMSGFNFLEINNRVVLTSADIVQGSLTNGTFEALVDQNYLLIADDISVYDNTLSFNRFPSGYFNSKGMKLNRIDSNLGVLILGKISSFAFKYFDLDLSTTGKWNTLNFNYTGAGPYSRIIFYPIISVSEYSSLDPDMKVNPKYQYEWDLNLKMFKIDFYLPRGLYTRNITYFIGDLSSDTLISSYEIFNVYGLHALLSVYSQEANQMFPYITTFDIKGSRIRNLELASDIVTIGWTFSIETLLHPLKYIILTVTSDYDPQGKNYTLTPSDSLNNDANLGDYELLFQVSGESVSQTYEISYALLEDESSRQSGYNQLYLQNAFFKFINTSSYNIQVKSPVDVIPDTTSPYLSFWSVPIESSYFYALEFDRAFEIDFVTKDADSKISAAHIPIVYLSPVISNARYACNTTLLALQDNGQTGIYKAFCNPEYGFGLPYGFSLSIYGIVDSNMNVRGYSGSQLSLESMPNYVKVSPVITFSPILEKITFNGTGALVLNGKKFGNSSLIYILEEKSSVWTLLNIQSFNYYTSSEMSFNYQTLSYFKIRIATLEGGNSNILAYGPSSGSNEEDSSSQGPPTPKPTTKPSCRNNCGGASRGTCLETGGCKCIGNYYGEDCTSEIIIIPTPSIDTNTPTTTIIVPESGGKSVKVTSLISIISYNELDKDGNIVKNQTFNEWIYTNIKDGLYLYQTKIDNTTNVNVTIQYFTQSTSIQFAGQTLTMNPSSIKYQISIDKYQFKSSLNQLQFIMSAALNTSNNDDKCTFNQFDNTIEDSEYLRLQIDNYSLYGRFIKVGLIDSRPRNIINSVVNIDGSTVDTQQQSTSTSSQYIGIVVPYYTQHAVIDPDFSVLIDTNTAKDKQGAVCSSSPKDKSKLSGAQIAGIVIGCVGFTAVVVTAVGYSLYKTKKTKQVNIKMQNRLKGYNNK